MRMMLVGQGGGSILNVNALDPEIAASSTSVKKGKLREVASVWIAAEVSSFFDQDV